MRVNRVDLAVAGAGPAGLAAATEVAARGGRVVVLDESPYPGGRLPSQVHLDPKQLRRLRIRWTNGKQTARRLADAARTAGVRIRCGMSVWHLFPDSGGWHVGACPAVPGGGSPADGFGYDAAALVIANGAVQKPMAFPGWTLPGVMTAGAALTMANVNGVLPGRRVVVVGIDSLGISAAQLLSACGVTVTGVVLPPDNGLPAGVKRPWDALKALTVMIRRPAPAGGPGFPKWVEMAGGRMAWLLPRCGIKVMGAPLMLRRALHSATGRDRVETVKVVDLTLDGHPRSGSLQEWPVDAVITASGLTPLTEAAQVAGCPLVNLPDLGGWVPFHGPNLESPLSGLFLAGSVTGVEGAAIAETQGRIAGVSAARYLRLADADSTCRDLARWQARLEAVRAITPAFLPGIRAGRIEMTKKWRVCCRL